MAALQIAIVESSAVMRERSRRSASTMRPAAAPTATTESAWLRCSGLQRTLAQGVTLADTPPLTAQTLFLLVDEELVRQNVTTGAALDEAHAALRLLEARGLLRGNDDGYVLRQPVRTSP